MNEQLEFLSIFDGKETDSGTLELFDFCGAFINKRNSYKQVNLPIDEMVFQFRDIDYFRQVTPAKLKVGKDSFEYYPSTREELVMQALRYMAFQKKIKATKDKKLITIGFKLHELRAELRRMGHGYKWKELSEAIDILSKASLSVGFNVGKRKVVWTGTYLFDVRGFDDGAAGEDSYRMVTLHPIASQAIVTKALRLIDYTKIMSFKNPLSRVLYSRLTHLIPNAQRGNQEGKGAIGLKIRIEDAFKAAGVPRRSKLGDDYIFVRKAIAELESAHILETDEIGWGYKTSEIKDGLIVLCPSQETVNEIIRANVASKGRTIPIDFQKETPKGE